MHFAKVLRNATGELALDKARKVTRGNRKRDDGDEVTADRAELQHIRASGVAGDDV